MRTFALVLVATAVAGLLAGTALAFSRPRLVKAANEAIGQAEPKANAMAEGREKVRAQAMVEEAKDLSKAAEADHSAGKHAISEAKAKAAKALAEMVK